MRRGPLLFLGFLGAVLVVLVYGIIRSPEASDDITVAPASTTTLVTSVTTTLPPSTTTSTSTTTTIPYDGWVDPSEVGTPYSETVPGVLTFRGSPTRSYYGAGPVPTAPTVQWSFPESGRLCSVSSVGGEAREWCGTGWTGQPAVFERDGDTWVTFGSYASAVHFLDGETGAQRISDFEVGDIIKGSVTVDPDGYPLIYSGSRDNFLHVIAFDRDEPEALWQLSADAVSPTKWNNDWDGSPLVIDDYLFEGGENSQFHIVKLNRGYDADGRVTVDPELVFNTPGWDDELTAALNTRSNDVSIENSVAISGNTVYFANSGGLVQGWDISGLADGEEPERVFRFWGGDDIDASIVIDDEGMLYVAAEYERANARSREVGQIFKLDPSRPDDPLVWKIDDEQGPDSGVWATPALYEDLLIVPTMEGRVHGIDRVTGEIRWSKLLTWHLWQSPVVVDDVLIQGDCEGVLRGYDLSDTSVEPPELWAVSLGGCIESTPVVWDGWIYVGTRSGSFYALSD